MLGRFSADVNREMARSGDGDPPAFPELGLSEVEGSVPAHGLEITTTMERFYRGPEIRLVDELIIDDRSRHHFGADHGAFMGN